MNQKYLDTKPSSPHNQLMETNTNNLPLKQEVWITLNGGMNARAYGFTRVDFGARVAYTHDGQSLNNENGPTVAAWVDSDTIYFNADGTCYWFTGVHQHTGTWKLGRTEN